ncbi:hypothetical protein LPB138_07945 [Urechidicola croceus]|uniref:DM13 domain-containing protein n=2 Tax=Urechidicola croceus TaxID=1850246 RepID=A0A1D8PBS5_9FLAO|nr:hypothetical protein LPB138_07945 [Urechidicola croceus]
MRKFGLSLFLVIFIIFGCSSNDNTIEVVNTISEDEQMEIVDSVTLNGSFVSDAHPTSGEAIANLDEATLSFLNFKTDDGPKLLVYLTTDLNATNFVSLGDLQGIEGDFTYNIPSNTDLSINKYVMIWCVDFSVSFGHAELN